MNKKEISEIKKQFTPSNCAITRICGCYVNGEKEKKASFKQAFLSLPEEEMFKYFDIFRKSLSGTIGKNLINMEFPLDSETVSYTHLVNPRSLCTPFAPKNPFVKLYLFKDSTEIGRAHV